MDTLTAIDHLKDVQPDWDTYGASAPVMSVRENAKSFIQAIVHAFGPEYANPIVGPTADGGVVLVWRKRGRPKVEAFFSPESSRFIVFQERKVLEKGRIKSLDFIKQYVTP